MQEEKILIIDDEASILRALRRTLMYNGYSVLVTTNPKKAIELMNESNIALLICDQRMPEMLGNEVLQFARKYYPSVVRVLITGYSDMESTIAAINQGQIFRFIAKPWNDEELLQVVEAAFEYRADSINKELILNSFLTEKEDWKKTVDQMSNSLDNSMKGAINALLKTVKIKDNELYQHSKRVEVYAMQIAAKSNLTDQQKVNLSSASLFHDIGKIAIRDKILYKNGPLSETDFGSMKQHPVFSMEIISELGFLDSVANIIIQHHEKVDGSGYPYGLQGSEIMQEAKILAIADVYDALVSDRVYHKGLSTKEAIAIISKGSGTHFDVEVIDIFLDSIQLSQEYECMMIAQNS